MSFGDHKCCRSMYIDRNGGFQKKLGMHFRHPFEDFEVYFVMKYTESDLMS